MREAKLTNFTIDDTPRAIRFVETIQVKQGVSCDTYSIEGDDSKDLAIVTVESGQKTPLQRVLQGMQTLEGYVSGQGSLTVRTEHGASVIYEFPGDDETAVEVTTGQAMQWHANTDSDLVFYEICEPPYQDGRFENLPE